ncbi:MAG: rRNA maturation RNase YbeY [Planctomycetia bacterium]|nr:rRNA maturation RNase YbeY [Planctomycetia bacterium]
MTTFRIALSDRQTSIKVSVRYASLLRRAVRAVFRDAAVNAPPQGPYVRRRVLMDIALVDDRTSHQVNVDFLGHDFPTDVISFPLEDDGETLVGELVVNTGYAARWAQEYGWPATHELVLYVIHGSLHLAGHDDHTDSEISAMRRAERRILEELHLRIPPTMPQSPEFPG